MGGIAIAMSNQGPTLPNSIVAAFLTGAVLFAAAGALPTWRTYRWRAWLDRHSLPKGGEDAQAAITARFEHALRKSWKPITYDVVGRSVWINKASLHMCWLWESIERADLTIPRAIAVFPTRELASLPLRVDPDLIEPEEIDAVPGRFVLAQPLRLLWTAAWWALFLCVGYLLLATVFSVRPRGSFVFVAFVTVAWVGFETISRIRDRGWAREIVVAPSCIQIKRFGGFDRYTPENAIVVVRPRRWFKQGISVILCTKDEAGSPPGAVLSFFGLEDAGFQKLWRAWIHPMRVDRIAGSDLVAGWPVAP